jgi:uncharacterized membrane protein YbhN (UPF0104 family)/tRNA A-37 threonylcarbamoyl transferase component Bud32/membrane-associated phospholipid phosphatase
MAAPRPTKAPPGQGASGPAADAGSARARGRAAGSHGALSGLRHVRRHPADLLRMLVGSMIVVASGMAAQRGHVFTFDANLFRLVNGLPAALGRPLLVVMQLGALAAVPVAAVLALAARRPRLARDLAVSGTLTWVLTRLIKALVGEVRPVALLHGVTEHGIATGLGYPSGQVAVAAALAAAAGPWLPRPARRVAWWAVWLVGFGRLYAGLNLPLDVAGGAALGWAVAAAVHLALGAPGGLPSVSAIRQGLQAAGIDPIDLQPVAGDARGSVPFVVGTVDGRRLFVKAVGREQHDADTLYKLWRWALFREVEDETPFGSAKQAVEHEAYLSLLAARAGVRTPPVIAATPAQDGHVLLVQEYVAGQTLDRLDPARVDDRLLAAMWTEVGRLRAAGIAHRDLRLANLLVDGDGRPWLLDFGFAEAAASPRRLARDVAELLASLASLVGADRAMSGATQTLGAEVVAQALPLLQPAALSTATRTSARSRPGLLDELRERVAAAAGTEPPELEPLTRVPPGTLLGLVAVGLAVHLLLPEVSELRHTVDALGAARWGWLAAGLGWAAVSSLAAAVAQFGAVDAPLPLGRTTLVQLAGSFTRLTPAGLGEAGLNVRYLQRAGLDRPTAVSAVGVKTAVGVLVHVFGLLVALVLVARTRLHPADLPGRWPLLVGLVAVLVGGGLVLWRALGRQRLVAPALRAGRALAEMPRRPAKAAQLVGGSAAVTLAYALALASCLLAFDVHLPLASTAAVYLGAAAVAAASPLPGGLVAMEAALVVGLTVAGAPAGPVVAGVLAFRLVTFWLPILPGWLAYRSLRAAGTI